MVVSLPGKLYQIGSISARSGLSVKTIRYYTDMGLLSPTVARSESGYRLFTDTVLNRLTFIKQAQRLGLSLSEIKEILEIRDRGLLPCHEVKARLQEKVEAINKQIQDLDSLRSELQAILAHWQENPSQERFAITICPNIQ
jgi:MerR family transcriptional regulator, copper efflux regulator